MKKNYARLRSLFFSGCLLFSTFLSDEVKGQFTIASDNAGNYSGVWSGNQGNGFGAWTFVANGGSGGFAGHFIGNPSSGGIAGMDSNSFGMFANPDVSGNEAKARRLFSEGALQFGDTFSFQMGLNFDAGNPNGFKGIDLLSTGGSVVLNFNMGNSSTISWARPGAGAGGTLFSAYGTQAMNFQITKVGANQYRIVATPRTGSTNFDETHTLANEMGGLEFYMGRMNAGGDNRQPYYNNLSISNSGAFNIAAGSETYSRSLSGTGNLSKSGNGTLVLTGSNSYTGTTTITGGTLQLNNISGGTLASTNNVTVNNGATLRISTNQTLNNLTLPSGATLSIDSGATLTIDGTFNFGGTIVGSGTLAYGSSGSLVYDLTGSQTTATEWPTTNGPSNVTMNTGSYTLNNSKIVTGDVTLATGSELTVPSSINLTVNDQLVNNGTVTLQNNANLIQAGTLNTNSGAITVQRNSASIMRLDYTLWSSPVAGQNLLDFSPNTVLTRFYEYNPSTDEYNSVVPSTTDFEEGKGYLIRMPDDHPTSPTVWNGEFNGVPNNGDVTISVADDTYNAVGNPYPSTISADDFINENGLTEAIYFWRKTNNAATSSYATYTLAGGAGTDDNSGDPLGLVPNGVIQVGQGFIVKSTSAALEFTNSMRIGNNADQFLRSEEIENNRIRITASGADGFYSQILVNYRTNATNDQDAALDGRYINDSEDAFYTVLNSEPFTIQARALPFENSDVVPLGFKTTASGTFTFTLNQADGLFQDNAAIFIKDNVLELEHNITETPYEFVTEAGEFNDRFELVYQETLSIQNPIANANAFIVYKEGNGIQLKSIQQEIISVTVYDISGRMLAFQQNSSTEIYFPLQNVSQQMLIVQFKAANGEVFSKKVVY